MRWDCADCARMRPPSHIPNSVPPGNAQTVACSTDSERSRPTSLGRVPGTGGVRDNAGGNVHFAQLPQRPQVCYTKVRRQALVTFESTQRKRNELFPPYRQRGQNARRIRRMTPSLTAAH